MEKSIKDSLRRISNDLILKDIIIYGKENGEHTASFLVYKDNMKIFNQWDESIFGKKLEFLKNTKIYKNSFIVNSDNNYNTELDCVNKDCSYVAYDLINEGLNPAILNLASNYSPCGGYMVGAPAQEESLCRMSTLSQSLYQFGNLKKQCVRDAHVNNISNVYPMDINYGGIYTPNVIFFRNNIDKYYTYRDDIFKCGVITVASIDGRKDGEEGKYCDSNYFLTKYGIEIQKNKIRTIFRIALDNKHDSIVLGALGCGVYKLKPIEISHLFMDVLNEDEFKNKFKKVVFAILETKNKDNGKDGKYKPFYDLFSK